MSGKISVAIYKVKIPLKSSYNLSFAKLDHFDSVIINFRSGTFDVYSESTALFGYSWETFEEMWETSLAWISAAEGSLSKLKGLAEEYRASLPFTATPILVSCEKLQGIMQEKTGRSSFPIVGTISADDPGTARTQAEILLKDGYKVIKVKVSGSPDADLAKISALQNITRNRALLRIDANQGYTADSIKPFILEMEPEGVELLEQPFSKDAWEDMQKLSALSQVPLMLDESVWNEEDIKRAADLRCARYVKLKLVKHSSLVKTLDLVRIAKSLGLKVILGNGVQTEIGCFDEAGIYRHAGLETAAEFNGFLKQDVSLSGNMMECRNGEMIVEDAPRVDESTLKELSSAIVKAEFQNDLEVEDRT